MVMKKIQFIHVINGIRLQNVKCLYNLKDLMIHYTICNKKQNKYLAFSFKVNNFKIQ